MGKMPDALRETIARNIRYCRLHKFPGRGGGKRCAESFGVSPQQWSPWESGKRTPDELRLEQIASFFGTTVEWFRRDHRLEHETAVLPRQSGDTTILRNHAFSSAQAQPRPGLPPFAETTLEEDINHYLWIMDLLTKKLTASGIRVIVSFEKEHGEAVQGKSNTTIVAQENNEKEPVSHDTQTFPVENDE